MSSGEIEIKRNGYLYIYLSNTSTDYPVYFDDFHIEHVRGPLLEEAQYYPFGLTMAGISSVAAGSLNNKLKYNGKEEQREEFSDGIGLECMDYGARMYDGQIGRWNQIDPLSDKAPQESPFTYSGNNPVFYVDLGGGVKYPAGKINEYRSRYPHFTEFLEKSFHRLASSSYLQRLFDTYGANGYSAFLAADFEWNSGPELSIVSDPGPGVIDKSQPVGEQMKIPWYGANAATNAYTGDFQFASGILDWYEGLGAEDQQAGLLVILIGYG